MFGLLSGVRRCLGEPCELQASEHIDKDMSSLFLRIREIPPRHSYTIGAPPRTRAHQEYINAQIYTRAHTQTHIPTHKGTNTIRAHLPLTHTLRFHHLFITDSSPDHPLVPGSSFACTFHDHLRGTPHPIHFLSFFVTFGSFQYRGLSEIVLGAYTSFS